MQNHRLEPIADAYLSLLQEALIGALTRDPAQRFVPSRPNDKAPLDAEPFDAEKRDKGLDWPLTAFSMIGRQRMQNIRDLVVDCVQRDVPGDLVETGVWRGGSCIFMRGILRALADRSRKVWVCDSFEGLPLPDPAFPADKGLDLQQYGQLAISQAEVEDNFRRFGLLDDQVKFLKGWFKDTLATAPISSIAVLRLDGDLYQSTIEALTALYPRVTSGGYVIVDDYHTFDACRFAVQDYLAAHESNVVSIDEIDGAGVFWQKP